MTTRTDFDPEEWQTIVGAPAIAGSIASAAERGDRTREVTAIAQAYVVAEKAHPGFDLLGEIVARSPEDLPSEHSVNEGDEVDSLKRIQAAVALLQARATPGEVPTYRRFAFEVAERVALAAGGRRLIPHALAMLEKRECRSRPLEHLRQRLGTSAHQGVLNVPTVMLADANAPIRREAVFGRAVPGRGSTGTSPPIARRPDARLGIDARADRWVGQGTHGRDVEAGEPTFQQEMRGALASGGSCG